MKKGVVIFKSKYGATKKYALWLQEELGFDCFEVKNITEQKLKEYDTIILGGGVYASGIAGLSFLKKNIQKLSDKKIAVFCVGASPFDENAINQIRMLHFKDELASIPLFYCRGIWNMDKMSFIDKNLCKLLQKTVAKQEPSTYEPWQKALMSCVGKNEDWTNKKYLEPLIDFVNK